MQWERNNFSEQFGMTLKMEEMKADLFLKTVLKNIDLPPPLLFQHKLSQFESTCN